MKHKYKLRRAVARLLLAVLLLNILNPLLVDEYLSTVYAGSEINIVGNVYNGGDTVFLNGPGSNPSGVSNMDYVLLTTDKIYTLQYSGSASGALYEGISNESKYDVSAKKESIAIGVKNNNLLVTRYGENDNEVWSFILDKEGSAKTPVPEGVSDTYTGYYRGVTHNYKFPSGYTDAAEYYALAWGSKRNVVINTGDQGAGSYEYLSDIADGTEEVDPYILNYILQLYMNCYDSSILDELDSGQTNIVVARSSVKDRAENGIWAAGQGPCLVVDIQAKSISFMDDAGTEIDLTDVFNKLVADSVNAEACPLLAGVVSSYKSFLDEKDQAQQEQAKSDASDMLVSQTYTDIYEAWAATMVNFVASAGSYGETTYADAAGLDLEDFYDVEQSILDDYYSGENLTTEEAIRLRAWFQIITSYGKEKKDVTNSDSSSHNVKRATFYTSNGGAYSYNLSFSLLSIAGAAQMETVRAQAIEAITNCEKMGTGVPSLTNAMSYAAELSKYYAAQMYGIEVDPTLTGQTEGTDLMKMPQSAYLESIMFPMDTPCDEGLTIDYLGLPAMGNMATIASSKAAYDAYFELQYILVLAATYAKNSGLTNANGNWENPALDEFLEECPDPANVNKSALSKVQDTIKCYVSISDALTFLGVEPWTDELKALVSYAAKVAGYEDAVISNIFVPNDKEAMSTFFNLDGSFSTDYKLGVQLSATYVPMVTNMYELSSVSMVGSENEDWVSRFHYPFGFYRKALFIDTNVNAAVNRYVTGKASDDRRVATLNDLLQPEKDVVLYMDTNFYNVDKLADLQGYTYNKVQNAEDAAEQKDEDTGVVAGIWNDITNTWAEWMDRDIASIVKTGGNNIYSRNVKKKVSEYGQKENDDGTDYVFSSANIDKYLKGYSELSDEDESVYNTYTPLQSFAVVSAIYRQSRLFNLLRKQVANNDPVFISSPNLAGTNGAGLEEFNTIYNYAMLKNLEASMGIDANTTIDKDSPLYIDIYGNILTESGIVVIPAMSNATLCAPSEYSIITAGFIDLYNNGVYQIPVTYNNADAFISEYLEPNEETGTYKLAAQRVDGVFIDLEKLAVSDTKSLELIDWQAESNLNAGSYLPFNQHVYMITEVLRGAPIENIDKVKEVLTTGGVLSKTGVYFAHKLEELSDALMSNTSGNSIVELPNLAFVDGVEYIILFLYKVIFAVTIVLLFYRLYIDAVQGVLGIKSVTSFIVSLFLFLVIAFSIPNLLDISYYQVNKRFLQNEIEYIAMLNLEKQNEGREIGITEVSEPETETELYLKVDDLSVPWYAVLDDVLFNATFKTIDDIYAKELDDSLLSNLPGMVKKGNGLYISINDIFKASTVEYDADTNQIYTSTNQTPYVSYVTPYYVILDSLVARINAYNYTNGIKDYNVKVMSNGNVRTSGMISPYLTSVDFMDTSQDVLGMKAIYGIPTTYMEVSPFDSEDLNRMYYSLWYLDVNEVEDVEHRLDELGDDARAFVANNKQLLGKISDEAFLKVMALSMAVAYNDEFNINAGNAIEIYEVDSRDIIRLSLASNKTVLSDSSKSFARFVFDNSGTLGVVTVAVLISVYFVSSLLKPVLVYVILACMIASLVIRRTIKRDASSAYEGLIITMSILCGTNVLYAVCLKASMSVADLGVSMPVSCVIQIIIQVAYLFILALFTRIVISDWQSLGFNKYSAMVDNVRERVHDARIHVRDTRMYGDVYSSGDMQKASNRGSGRTQHLGQDMTGSELLERMKRSDEERQNHRGRR